MTGIAVGNCPRCGAATSYFARSCANCHARNLPNPVAAIAVLSVVLLAGGLIALGGRALRSGGEPQSPPSAGAPSTPEPTTDTKTDYGWLVTAMAECEEEAKLKLDRLNFLIVPVTATGVSLPGWSPSAIGTIGNAAVLLHSTDALIGLRNQVLVLYQKPMTFAVSDPATNTVYKWKPAVGVTALTTRETGLARLTLGFEIPEVANEIEWGPTINLKQGTCYWINPLVRAGARSP